MREFEIQKEFLDSVRDLKEKASKDLDIYEELVYIRFFEVITGCYPIFTQMVTEGKVQELVKAFLQNRPTSPYIWNAPKEFLEFVKEQQLVTSKKELEVLDLELTELKFYISPHRARRISFSWKRRLKLAKTAEAKKFSYRSLDNAHHHKETIYYLVYQDLRDKEVYHFEITEFMYYFLKLLRVNPPLKALKIIKKRLNLKGEESKEILEEGLRYLSNTGILA